MKSLVTITIALSWFHMAVSQSSVNAPPEAIAKCWDIGKPCDLRGEGIAECRYLKGPAMISCTCGAEALYGPDVTFT
jgi:hypothetical protein